MRLRLITSAGNRRVCPVDFFLHYFALVVSRLERCMSRYCCLALFFGTGLEEKKACPAPETPNQPPPYVFSLPLLILSPSSSSSSLSPPWSMLLPLVSESREYLGLGWETHGHWNEPFFFVQIADPQLGMVEANAPVGGAVWEVRERERETKEELFGCVWSCCFSCLSSADGGAVSEL